MQYRSWQSILIPYFLGFTTISTIFSPSLAVGSVVASGSNNKSSWSSLVISCSGQDITPISTRLSQADMNRLLSCEDEIIPQLLQALESSSWEVKITAVYTLGLLGVEARSTIPALSNLLQDSNSDVRFVTAQTLGKLGSQDVIPLLVKALQDNDENVRVIAVKALQQIENVGNDVKPALIKALWDGNWYVRSSAAKIISKLGLEEYDIPQLMEPWETVFHHDRTGFVRGQIIPLMMAVDPTVNEQVQNVGLFFARALSNNDPNVRKSAAIALKDIISTRPGQVNYNEYIDALLSASTDESPEVRREVYLALEEGYSASRNYHLKWERTELTRTMGIDFSSREQGIEAALIQGLEDTDSQALAAAITATARFKSPQITSYLTQALYNQNSEVRVIAGKNLSKDIALPLLINILQDTDYSTKFQKSSIETIITSRWQFTDVEKEIIRRSLERLASDENLDTRVHAALSLLEFKEDSSLVDINIFIEGLQAQEPEIRLNAIFGLEKICTRDVEKSRLPQKTIEYEECSRIKSNLELLLSTESKLVQYGAALAITSIYPEEQSVIPVLGRILLEEYDYDLRNYTKAALSKMDSQKAYLALIESLEIDDKRVRFFRSFGLQNRIVDLDISPNLTISNPVLINALQNEKVRFLAANSFDYWRSDQIDNLSQVKSVASSLSSFIQNNTFFHEDLSTLNEIFKLKDQDLRRSAVYALGKIGQSLISIESDIQTSEEDRDTTIDINELRNIINDITRELIEVTQDDSNDINVQWMAAVFLQEMGIDTIYFFEHKGIINPQNVRWQFPHWQAPWIDESNRTCQGRCVGLSFDIYSAGIIYDGRTPGGSLSGFYETLRNLLSRK